MTRSPVVACKGCGHFIPEQKVGGIVLPAFCSHECSILEAELAGQKTYIPANVMRTVERLCGKDAKLRREIQ